MFYFGAPTQKVTLRLEQGFDLDLRVSVTRKEALQSHSLFLLETLPDLRQFNMLLRRLCSMALRIACICYAFTALPLLRVQLVG